MLFRKGKYSLRKKSKDEDEALASKTQSGIQELKPADADAHAVLEYLVFVMPMNLSSNGTFPYHNKGFKNRTRLVGV